MRNAMDVFHLAIPSRDLDESETFYIGGLGCRLARRYDDRITIDFFGDQVVCHLAPDDIDSEPRMYPRHFGVTFRLRGDFELVLQRAIDQGLEFFREPFDRFAGRPEKHSTFFLRDPSNNLVEFKHYDDPQFRY
jgi:hypothetical protein